MIDIFRQDHNPAAVDNPFIEPKSAVADMKGRNDLFFQSFWSSCFSVVIS